jgi:hypothetical protein
MIKRGGNFMSLQGLTLTELGLGPRDTGDNNDNILLIIPDFKVFLRALCVQ